MAKTRRHTILDLLEKLKSSGKEFDEDLIRAILNLTDNQSSNDYSEFIVIYFILFTCF